MIWAWKQIRNLIRLREKKNVQSIKKKFNFSKRPKKKDFDFQNKHLQLVEE